MHNEERKKVKVCNNNRQFHDAKTQTLDTDTTNTKTNQRDNNYSSNNNKLFKWCWGKTKDGVKHQKVQQIIHNLYSHLSTVLTSSISSYGLFSWHHFVITLSCDGIHSEYLGLLYIRCIHLVHTCIGIHFNSLHHAGVV